IGDGPPRAHVSTHSEGTRAPRRRTLEMGAADRRHCGPHAPAGGIRSMSLLTWLPWVRERDTRELADELRAHLEMAEADLFARGVAPNDAAARARREFGNVGLVQEIARDNWGRTGTWIEQL